MTTSLHVMGVYAGDGRGGGDGGDGGDDTLAGYGDGNATEMHLPQNVEAEAAVLGSILIDPQAMAELAETLRSEHFYGEAHRVIFQAALDLYAQSEPADYITLCDELTRRGALEDVGGSSYVSSLANNVPTSAHAAHYAKRVMDAAFNRSMIHLGGQVAAIGYKQADALVCAQTIEALVLDATHDVVSRQRARSAQEGLGDLLTKLGALSDREPGATIGTPTGYRDLDALLGGLQPSDLILLAARPSVGKTALALSISEQVAQSGRGGVLLYSMEMSEEQVLQRLLAMQASVDVQRLRLGRLNEQEWQRVWDAAARIADMPLYVDDGGGLSLAEVQARTRRHLAAHPDTALVVVDYIQLMQGANVSSGGGGRNSREASRAEALGEISRGLKQLAKEIKLPILALSQLSRAVESRQDKRPMLSDLAESGSLERDADVVLFLYRHEMYYPESDRQHIADVIAAKHRNGPTGTISLFFQAAQTRFLNLERHYGQTSDRGDHVEPQQWWNNGASSAEREDAEGDE